jgi:hypothetical protein
MNPCASLHRKPETSLHETYLVLGVSCAVSTNSEDILRAARASFGPPTSPDQSPALTMTVWVDPDAQGSAPWPQPYFRGLGHLTYGGLDGESCFLLDHRCRHVVGRFSPLMARHRAYWQRVILPTITGLMSESLGRTALHCACVEWEGEGLLLAGPSGAGKSTLSLALAQFGFSLLADDWTYFSNNDGQVHGWNIRTPLKLLPDAAGHFPELQRLKPETSLNGESAYEVDPEALFGVTRSFACAPRFLVFLERQDRTGHELSRMSPEDAAASLERDLEELPAELDPLKKMQSQIISGLVQRDCWLLRYGATPRETAAILAPFLAGARAGAGKRCHGARARPGVVPRTGPDILRRFTPTPFVADYRFAGRSLRLETNSPDLLRRIHLPRAGEAPRDSIENPFSWRLVSDSEAGLRPPWPSSCGISADHLYFENIGQRSFLAIDAAARTAVGFLSEQLVNDRSGSNTSFFTKLFVATASSLGLTALSAACIVHGAEGILMFSPQANGRAIASQDLGRATSVFLPEQVALVDSQNGVLRAWRNLWLTPFYAVAKLFPEPATPASLLRAGESAAPGRERNTLCRPHLSSPVTLVCSILLTAERGRSAQIVPLSRAEYDELIAMHELFGSLRPNGASQQALRDLPAYRLVPGEHRGSTRDCLYTLLGNIA